MTGPEFDGAFRLGNEEATIFARTPGSSAINHWTFVSTGSARADLSLGVGLEDWTSPLA